MNLLADLGQAQYLYLLAVMVFAGVVHGAIGLGFPMVATPLIAIFLDVRLAILLTLLPTVSVNVLTIWGGTDQRESLREYAPMFGAVLCGSIVGAWMLATMDPSPFRLALAVLIVLYLWTAITGYRATRWIEPGKITVVVGFGLVAGVSGGITNVMVAILVIYFMSLEMPRSKMVPIFNTCFLIGKLSQMGVLALAGLVTFSLLGQTAPLAVAAVAGLLGGKRLGAMISVDFYRKVLHILLFVLAIILLAQFTYSLLQLPASPA